MILSSTCSLTYAWDLGTLTSAADMLGADKVAEKALIGKFVKAFRKDRPISTSIDDAYPKAAGIEDFKPRPVSRKMMEDLRQKGNVSLKPGVYDFYFQSFCLHAGKYAPKSNGMGYAIAPLKGSQAEVIKHILSTYPKHSDIKQWQAQYLIWAIEVGCKYGDLSMEERAVANKILSKDDLKSLGKSFWDVLPKEVRARLFEKLQNQLPEDVRDDLEVYNDIQSKIADSQYTYEQLEQIAVQLGEPPLGGQKNVVDWGTWYDLGKGYYMRVFPSGFTNTRVQIYVPNESGSIAFNPGVDIGAPANTSCQRLGFGNAGTGDGGYSDENEGANNQENRNNIPGQQAVQDAINESLKNVDNWHSEYGKFICNIFVTDVADRLGYSEFDGLRANQIYDYMSNNPAWGNTTDPKEAQQLANEGCLVIGASQDLSGSGHVVAVDPFGNVKTVGDGSIFPSIYDANLPNSPANSSNSWRYDDNPSNNPKWFYRK